MVVRLSDISSKTGKNAFIVYLGRSDLTFFVKTVIANVMKMTLKIKLC